MDSPSLYLDPYKFFFELPLYNKIISQANNTSGLIDLLSFSGRIDAYNPNLKENTTYIVQSDISRYSHPTEILDTVSYISYDLKCVRNDDLIRCYVHIGEIRDDDDEITEYIVQKVGQYPSIAVMHIAKVKNYEKILNKEQLKEFTRAIGLASNGVGIGSFVYLRRIFEYLIQDAFAIIKMLDDIDEKEFESARMSDKINMLKEYLPDFLVENRALYGILSKGIHELGENECLTYFEVVKTGIELILEEKLQKYNQQKRIEDARKAIQATQGKIK